MQPTLEKNPGKGYYRNTATPENLKGPVSKSLLWEFNKSPWKWLRADAREETPAMAFGSLVHTLALTPGSFEKDYAVSPFDSFRTKEAQAWRDDQRADGKTVITEDQLADAQECASAAMSDEDAEKLLVHGYDAEVAVYAGLGETPVKGMIDIALKGGMGLIDLKTISSIESLQNLEKVIIQRGYHWQAALYSDLYSAVSNMTPGPFHFLFVESSAPYETAVVKMSENMIDLGRAGYMNALAKWQECVAKNHFPKAIEGIQEVNAPKWAMMNESCQ